MYYKSLFTTFFFSIYGSRILYIIRRRRQLRDTRTRSHTKHRILYKYLYRKRNQSSHIRYARVILYTHYAHWFLEENHRQILRRRRRHRSIFITTPKDAIIIIIIITVYTVYVYTYNNSQSISPRP